MLTRPRNQVSFLPSASTKAALSVVITVLLWSSAFPGIRAALTSFSPGAVAFVRYLIASVVFGLYAVAARPQWPRGRDFVRVALAGVVGIALYNFALNSGEQSVDAGAACFIMSVAPIFTALLGVAFLNERMRALQWAGIAISFSGVAVVGLWGRDGVRLDHRALFVLAAAMCQALQFVVQKPLMSRYRALPVTACLVWVGTCALTPFLPTALLQVSTASSTALWAVIFLGAGPAAVAYVTWSYALANFPVSRVSSFLYAAPPVSVVVSYVLLHEIPTFSTLIGGTIALGGVIVVNLYRR